MGGNLLCANARGVRRGELKQELNKTSNVYFNFLWFFPAGGAINYCLNMDIFMQMLQGVDHVHKAGLMHRDLKVIPLSNYMYLHHLTNNHIQFTGKVILTIGLISTLSSYSPHFYR